jgi:hypothetical protein
VLPGNLAEFFWRSTWFCLTRTKHTLEIGQQLTCFQIIYMFMLHEIFNPGI